MKRHQVYLLPVDTASVHRRPAALQAVTALRGPSLGGSILVPRLARRGRGSGVFRPPRRRLRLSRSPGVGSQAVPQCELGADLLGDAGRVAAARQDVAQDLAQLLDVFLRTGQVVLGAIACFSVDKARKRNLSTA